MHCKKNLIYAVWVSTNSWTELPQNVCVIVASEEKPYWKLWSSSVEKLPEYFVHSVSKALSKAGLPTGQSRTGAPDQEDPLKSPRFTPYDLSLIYLIANILEICPIKVEHQEQRIIYLGAWLY